MTKRRKRTKPASEAQKRARERNWNKGQIMSMHTVARNIYKSKTTTSKEKNSLVSIGTKLNIILRDWKK